MGGEGQNKWHIVMIKTLKTKASNFVNGTTLYWKPVKWSKQ